MSTATARGAARTTDEAHTTHTDDFGERGAVPGGQRRRPSYRPPVGVPEADKEPRRVSAAVSLAVHALIFLLLFGPALAGKVVSAATQGAGGPGPAGGGGGGSEGTGGDDRPVSERLRYIQVAPAEQPTPTPPEEEQPEEEKEPELPVPQVDIETEVPAATVSYSVVPGTGGGTGNDGTGGSGPGRGGGVGSGVGTGRGTADGPGTGGGEGTIYPPRPTELVMPPWDAPQRVKGSVITVVFDVDESGRVLSVTFTPTKDAGYNRRLRERLESYRFRPATRWDGTPVRAQLQMTLDIS